MKKEKEISFNDFLQEDFLVIEKIPDQVLELIRQEDFTPELFVEELPASETEMKEYWKKLRHYFRSGEKISPGKLNFYPALLAPFLTGRNPETDYPYYIENEKIIPLRQLLHNSFAALFTEKEAKILKENLIRIEENINLEIADRKTPVDFLPVAHKSFNKVKELDVRGDEGKSFIEHVNKLFEALPTEGSLINFSELTPFYLLKQQLETLHDNRNTFLKEIKKISSALKDLISVEKEKEEDGNDTGKLGRDYLFAESIIAFDKVVDLMPGSASERMSQKRLNRINEALMNLDQTELLMNKRNALILLNYDVEEIYSIKELFSQSDLKIFNTNGCKEAVSKFENEISLFVNLIVSFRIAELELKDKYEESIHDDYFKLFDWRQLSDDELSLFPPIVLINNTNNILINELSVYNKIISKNIPVKSLIINTDEETTEIFRQELAAITISQRGAFVFQGGNDNLILLSDAIKNGLRTSEPVLWHVLNKNNYLSTSAAIESRKFPRIYYNYQLGNQSGSRLDINSNPQPEKLWPLYSIEIKNGKEKQIVEISFTVADERILNKASADELEIIPERYHNDDVIAIADYLISDNDELIGKVPFVWVVDENKKIRKAAIPFSWLPACKERSDFWQYIQEAGGVNSFHVNKALENAREDWNNKKEIEMQQLHDTYIEEVEKVRNEAAGKAMDKLVSVLLDLDNIITAPVAKTVEKKISIPANLNGATIQEEKTVEINEETIISSEPWVESFKCTTCNDCTDKLPNVFKYNSDKQAYIYDAGKATFRQLVEVAEKCPAKCIHTGDPLNKNESGLQELLKRAEPFR